MAWVPPLLNFVECASEEPICTSYTNYTTIPQSVDADDDISTKSSIVAAVAAAAVKSDDTQESQWLGARILRHCCANVFSGYVSITLSDESHFV